MIFSFLEGGCGGVQDWKNRHSSQQSCLDVQYAGVWYVQGSKCLSGKYTMIENKQNIIQFILDIFSLRYSIFDENRPQIITNATLSGVTFPSRFHLLLRLTFLRFVITFRDIHPSQQTIKYIIKNIQYFSLHFLIFAIKYHKKVLW